MEVAATYTFEAPRARVWRLLTDPQAIAGCLPGCESMEAVGEDAWRATLKVRIGPINASFQGTVRMTDKREPESYTLQVEGKGRFGVGSVNGTAALALAEESGGAATRVAVEGKAQVSGKIATFGQRLLGGVSKKAMDDFFACLEKRANQSGEAT